MSKEKTAYLYETYKKALDDWMFERQEIVVKPMDILGFHRHYIKEQCQKIEQLEKRILLLQKNRNDFFEQNKLLKEKYGRHLEDCPARKRFHIPDCPSCGSRRTRWRHGVGFEHEKSCMDCEGPAWTPEEVFGECTCGFEDIKKGE